MRQTTLQKLRYFISDGLNDFDESIKVSEIWTEINRLLEDEKIQIQDAFDDGQANWDEKCQDHKNGKEYYLMNFKKN